MLDPPPPGHRCLRCSASCIGVRVRLQDDETEAIAERAHALGVAAAVQGGWLRQNWGRCALLDDDGRCRLHLRWGRRAKPRVCQQYPWVAVWTGAETRVGVDPGCFGWWRGRTQGGPPDDLLSAQVLLSAEEAAREAAYLESAPATVSALCAAAGLDRTEATRRATERARLPWERLLDGPDIGSAVREASSRPTVAWPSPSVEALAAWGTTELVRLRLAPALPLGTTLDLCVTGALLCADLPGAEARLAAWFRLVRLPAFAATLALPPV